MNDIHIGEIICRKMKAEGRTKKWLAEQVGCDPSSLCKALKKNYLDTDLLYRISLAMHHDFFSYLSAYFKECQQYKQDKG
ncbi:MAG: XRE family transcriptional regulator [Tannerella sp.]|nr:XRE family transcriptional regulator [Tannerella sp.]